MIYTHNVVSGNLERFRPKGNTTYEIRLKYYAAKDPTQDMVMTVRWSTYDEVHFGYTFNEVKAKSINLGLDLKGGMNVTLQVQLQDLVKVLGGENADTEEFKAALALAEERSKDSRLDFVALFAEAWKETSNGAPLSKAFGTYDLKDRITPETSDDAVIEVIRAEAESAV